MDHSTDQTNQNSCQKLKTSELRGHDDPETKEVVREAVTQAKEKGAADNVPMKNTAFEDPHIQTVMDGKGPLFHRRYFVDIKSQNTPEQLMADIRNDINEFSPQMIARFEKKVGNLQTKRLEKGDEFQIYISGPWNGPVRVIETTPTSFSLATLEGHLEAGEIHFRAKPLRAGHLRFEIESVARSADKLIDILYDKLPVVRLGQTQMWISFCKKVALKEANPNDPHFDPKEAEVEIITERADPETGEWTRD